MFVCVCVSGKDVYVCFVSAFFELPKFCFLLLLKLLVIQSIKWMKKPYFVFIMMASAHCLNFWNYGVIYKLTMNNSDLNFQNEMKSMLFSLLTIFGFLSFSTNHIFLLYCLQMMPQYISLTYDSFSLIFCRWFLFSIKTESAYLFWKIKGRIKHISRPE